MTSSTYLTFIDSAIYCGRTGNREALAKWTRRHLVPHIPVYRLPNSNPVLKRQDIDLLLDRHREDPVNVSAVVAQVMGRTSRKGGAR